MLAAALRAEVAAYVEAFAGELDEHGRRLVVRNGHHYERQVTTAAGAVSVRAPRVNDRGIDEATGQRKRFARRSCRRGPGSPRESRRCCRWAYLHGLSSGDFAPMLSQFLGSAQWLPPATITRLTKDWQDESVAFNKRSLAETDYVYVWVDGIHLKVRLEQDKVCLLIMIGVRADGTKALIDLDDWHRESTESWADLLPACKRRGMRAPVLAVGDGALGFWAAVRTVFPKNRGAALLVPQNRKRSQRAAEVSPAGRESRAGRDVERRGQDPRHHGGEGVRRSLRPPSGPRLSRRSPTTSTSC